MQVEPGDGYAFLQQRWIEEVWPSLVQEQHMGQPYNDRTDGFAPELV